MKKVILFALAFTFVILPLKSKAEVSIFPEIISIEKNQEVEKKLRKMNLDFLMEWNNKVYIVASFDELLMLRKEGIPYALETSNFYPCTRKGISIQSGVNGAYHSYKELEEDLFALERAHPLLARVIKIGESLERRNIYALKISDNVYQDEEEAEVLFIGCHHAREWISVEVPLLLAKYLLENYALDSEVRNLVDQSQVWIVPLLNPDGLEYSIHFYRYWRKNRRDNGDGSYGVDLNRNYGCNWGFDNLGSSPYSYSEVYRGASPFSEPETQAVRDLFAARNFQTMITYHSYSQVILYPWGYTEDPPDEAALLDQIAATLSGLLQSVNGNVYEFGQAGKAMYLTNGDATDWIFSAYGIPSYTIELPPVDILQGGFFNAEADIQSIFNENLPAMLYLIEWSVENFGSSPDFTKWTRVKIDQRETVYDRLGYGRGSSNAPRREDAGVKAQTTKLEDEEPEGDGLKLQTSAPKIERGRAQEKKKQPSFQSKKDWAELCSSLPYLLRLLSLLLTALKIH